MNPRDPARLALPLLAAAIVLGPFATVVISSPPLGSTFELPGPRLIAWTLAWAAGVALLALVLAIPGAILIARRGSLAAPLILTPLLLPTYLAYSGYTILRAPGSALGNWLSQLSAAGDTAPAAMAGRLTALLALALWSWPLASLALGASIRRLDANVLDALALDAGKPRRALELARMIAPGAAGAFLLVLLVMLGSSIPFHLAQVKTAAIVTWLQLQETANPLATWPTAWPSVAAAIIAAWWISGRLTNLRHAASADESARPAGPLPILGLALILTLSVLLPFGLFAANLKELSALWTFWRLNAEAVATSLGVAATTALAVGTIAVLVGATANAPRSFSRRAAIFLLLTSGLVPGILVGSAWSITSLKLPPAIGDSVLPLIAAHIARFSLVGVLAGSLAAATEPRELSEIRRIEGVPGLRGWLTTCGMANAPLLAAAALIAGVLSFHEIESSVMVQPPGLQSLAQRLLNDLHQLRMDAMSAAALWLVGAGILVAIAASTLLARWRT